MKSRRLAWIVAGGCAAAAGAWLLATRSAPPSEGRNYFGHWRTLPILMAAALGWTALLALVSTRSRRWLFGGLFGSVLAIAALLLLEVGTVLGFDYGRLAGDREEVLGARAVPDLDLRGQTLPDIAAARNLRAAPIPFHYRTDRRGFRNAIDREAGDIYLLGDSILVAALLPFEQTVAARLEAITGLAVVNVALIGIGVQREHELLRDSGLPLAGRRVVHFITEGNDLGDSARYRLGTAPAASSLWARSLSQQLVLWTQRLLQPVPYEASWRRGFIGDQEVMFHWVGDAVVGLDAEIPPILASLAATRALVEGQGGSYELALVPSKYRIAHRLCRWPPGSPLQDPRGNLGPLRDAAAAWAAANAVPFTDFTAAMTESAAAGLLPYFTDDTHPNAVGHRIMAGALAARPAVSSPRDTGGR